MEAGVGEASLVAPRCMAARSVASVGAGYMSMYAGEAVDILYIGSRATGDEGWAYGQRADGASRGWVAEVDLLPEGSGDGRAEAFAPAAPSAQPDVGEESVAAEAVGEAESDASAPDAMQWEVKLDSGRWAQYEQETNAVLERARRSGASTCSLTLHGWRYEIDLARDLQRNLDTGKKRPVRRMPRPDGDRSDSTPASLSWLRGEQSPSLPQDAQPAAGTFWRNLAADPTAPEQCVEDPLTQMRPWPTGKDSKWVLWPYCLACECWSDRSHINAKRHQKALRRLAASAEPGEPAEKADAARADAPGAAQEDAGGAAPPPSAPSAPWAPSSRPPSSSATCTEDADRMSAGSERYRLLAAQERERAEALAARLAEAEEENRRLRDHAESRRLPATEVWLSAA